MEGKKRRGNGDGQVAPSVEWQACAQPRQGAKVKGIEYTPAVGESDDEACRLWCLWMLCEFDMVLVSCALQDEES